MTSSNWVHYFHARASHARELRCFGPHHTGLGGGIDNFFTMRGAFRGDRAKISWIQAETGSAISWKCPSCQLEGDGPAGEFCSVAIANNLQQADTGTKMIHTAHKGFP